MSYNILRAISVLSVLIFLGLYIFNISPIAKDITKAKVQGPKNPDWKTYQKKETLSRGPASYNTTHKSVYQSTETTDTEKEKFRLPDDIPMSELKTPVLDGRHLMGGPHIFKMSLGYLQNLEKINSPRDDWESELSHELLKFHDPSTKLFVRPLRGLLRLEGEKLRYVEEVIVSFKLERKPESSFKALVDSETGKILFTWDRTIHEELRPSSNLVRRKVQLIPSGVIKNNTQKNGAL